MKRIVFAAGLILALVSGAAPAADWTVGVKGGLYTANTTEMPAGWNESSFKSGFAAGAFVEYRLDESFSLQPEVLYAQKGLAGSFGFGGFGYTFTANYDYVEIPLLIKYRIAPRSRVVPYLLLGPCLGINVSADLEIEQHFASGGSASGTVDYSSVLNTTEFSWIFAAGLGTGLGPGEITFDARFDLGLSKVYSGGTVTGKLGGREFTDTVFPGSSKSLGFALLIGYAY